MSQIKTKLFSITALGVSALLVGCASEPKIVNVNGMEATPYCLKRLDELNNQNNNYIAKYNYYSDVQQATPFISKDWRPKEADFFQYTQKSIKPFLKAELGVPNAMTNNEVCGQIFDYASNELNIDYKYVQMGEKLLGINMDKYNANVSRMPAVNDEYTSSIISYSDFKERSIENQDKTRTEIKLNRVDYVNYVQKVNSMN